MLAIKRFRFNDNNIREFFLRCTRSSDLSLPHLPLPYLPLSLTTNIQTLQQAIFIAHDSLSPDIGRHPLWTFRKATNEFEYSFECNYFKVESSQKDKDDEDSLKMPKFLQKFPTILPLLLINCPTPQYLRPPPPLRRPLLIVQEQRISLPWKQK